MLDSSVDPAGSHVLIERPRLVDLLAARFARRLTIVVGGGGAGKTTLLRQAIAVEVDHIDAFHSCAPADRDDSRLASELLGAVAHAVATAVPLGDPVTALAELVLAESPRQVAIVVDDTHVLDTTGLFRDLLETLPVNGHLVLAGRRRPALDTARLDAAGELLEIGQDDLLMTKEEQIDFANRRSVDVGLLEGAEGWPAFIELAAGGSQIRSRRYLEEEALREIAPDRRRALAAFALVRGGDDAIAAAVSGHTLTDLVADIPLVRWEGDRARLHDLWAELLVDELDPDARRRAALAASAIHRERGEIEPAIDLARMVGDWDDFGRSLAAAVQDGVDGGLRSDQLRRWRSLVPPEHVEAPVVVLIDGLIEREVDPTSELAWDLLDRAAAAFQESGHHALELTALMQLGYVSRIHADPERITGVLERAETLAAKYPDARPFLGFGEAWTAMARGRPDLQLAALEPLHDDDLPPIWQITRNHLISHALFNLGRPFEALERVPRDVDTLPIPIPGALVTESQCLWYAGQPERALARRPDGMSERHGARDRFIAGGWAALMCAYAGDVVGARHGSEVAVSNLGANPSPLLLAQTQAIETLVKVVEGREREAADELTAILEFVPLGGGVSEQMLRNALSIPYVLCPETREYWDAQPLGPALRHAREIARAFTAAREGTEPGALAAIQWPEPGFAAANLPVNWAMELALRGVAANRHEGRRLAAWLCEHWGDPARAALRGWLDDDQLGSVARDVAASTPTPPDGPVEVRLLGATSVLVDDYASSDPNWRRERVRALMAALVLKPETTREQLAGTLWPDAPTDKAAKSLRTTLNYLHGVLEPRRPPGDATWFVRIDGNAISLNPTLSVDLWKFRALLDDADDAEREGKPNLALPLLVQAARLWRGDLAEDLDLEILELERIHLRSRFVRASCRAAELLVATRRPAEAIEVARPALEVDRWNERTYFALADAYDALGDHTSARAVIDRGTANIGLPLDRRSTVRR